MFIKKLLVVSTILATSSLAGNTFAQDSNRDGRDGRERLNPMRGERVMERPRMQHRASRRVIGNMDTDGDTLISQDEFIAQRTRHFERQFDHRDNNGDQLLSLDETRPHRPPLNPEIDSAERQSCIAENGGTRGGGENGVVEADSDSDGFLSEEEFFMHLEQRAFDEFARIDADGNGQLTTSELTGRMADRNSQRRAVRQCLQDAGNPLP